MKNIYITILFFLVLSSCRQERSVQKTQKDVGFFVSETKTVSNVTINSSANSGTPGYRTYGQGANRKQFLEEIRTNKIPQTLPNEEFPDWKSFQQYYYAKRGQLSLASVQFCSEMLLKSYDLLSYSATDTEVKDVIIENLSFLATNSYNGYELLYKYLVWLKNNNIKEFETIKRQISLYAKPVLGQPDPNLKDDPRIEENPFLKEKMQKLIADMKKNDSYIDKIKSL